MTAAGDAYVVARFPTNSAHTVINPEGMNTPIKILTINLVQSGNSELVNTLSPQYDNS